MDTFSDSLSFITPAQLLAALGRPDLPPLLDVRREERFRESGRMLPGALRVDPSQVPAWAAGRAPGEVWVYCVHGHEVSQGAAATLCAAGWQARWLEAGYEGARAAGVPTWRCRADWGAAGAGPSRWVTRNGPKVDRVACPWLIRRFIDPRAEFSYVPAAGVLEAAGRTGAIAFDIEGAPVTHAGERCSFDALLHGFELDDPALHTLAGIVRGADTSRPEIAPQAAGLLAVSLGLSHLHAQDDNAMLRAALPVYDALYAWCRHAQGERHTWRTHAAGPAQ